MSSAGWLSINKAKINKFKNQNGNALVRLRASRFMPVPFVYDERRSAARHHVRPVGAHIKWTEKEKQVHLAAACE